MIGAIFAGYACVVTYLNNLQVKQFILISGVGCGIHATNSAEMCESILQDTNCKIVVVENKQQRQKIIQCKDKLGVKKIIQYSGEPDDDYDGLVISVRDYL
jgi:long-subunit acyl-CoA synthetase (AMP-forming)